MAAILNSSNPNFSESRDQGSKLLIYQAWSDAVLRVLATIGHYESAVDSDAAAEECVKLFVMPGVLLRLNPT